jgi:UDP-N-acetylmuramoyl-tripeptide--D-alanyl-D-alanine ligase
MDSKPLLQIARWLGTDLAGAESRTVTNVSTDTRTLVPGSLFVALRGDHFDGHQFLAAAQEAGAVGAIVDQIDYARPDFPQLRVADTLTGLQQLASEYRQTLSCKVIGITGSNGKTSTKEMVSSILGRRFRVHKTTGNLNNHIGVPLSILGASNQDQFVVLEYGMNHGGEIAQLTEIVRPDFGLITNIGVAHIEFLGTREAIAREKATLIERLPADGVAVLPATDDFIEFLVTHTKARVVRAGVNTGAVQARNPRLVDFGFCFDLSDGAVSVPVRLPVPGEHMAANATLAAAMALALGMSLEDCSTGLAQLSLPGDRMKIVSRRGITIVNDAYNANPDSMVAALKTVAQLPASGRRVAVLGAMGELGRESVPGHERVGVAAAKLAFDFLVTVGPAADPILSAARTSGLEQGMAVSSHAEAAEVLTDYLKPGDLLLVKGSRSAAMDKVIQELEALHNGG